VAVARQWATEGIHVSEDVRFAPVATLPLEAAAALIVRSFEGYFYPAQLTAEELARRARHEQIDLWRSTALLVGGEPAAVAMLAIRGARAWCAGFGVAQAHRGRGLSHRLAEEMVRQAREAGAAELWLEVLTRNERAIRTYARAGFRAVRDLLVVEWRRAEGAEPPSASPDVVEANLALLLRSFARLHQSPAAWQRDLPALLVREPVLGYTLGPPEEPLAYALVQAGPGEMGRIVDLGASDAASAGRVLAALQARFARLLSVNEPLDAPHTPAFAATGFAEVDRQHEMVLALDA
jgi:GNAT superfamily N-acetyltransferase